MRRSSSKTVTRKATRCPPCCPPCWPRRVCSRSPLTCTQAAGRTVGRSVATREFGDQPKTIQSHEYSSHGVRVVSKHSARVVGSRYCYIRGLSHWLATRTLHQRSGWDTPTACAFIKRSCTSSRYICRRSRLSRSRQGHRLVAAITSQHAYSVWQRSIGRKLCKRKKSVFPPVGMEKPLNIAKQNLAGERSTN